jgi:cobalt-zinc-cadmium efflux system outer membrane protein
LQTNSIYGQQQAPEQDTIRLEWKQAEKMFLDNNLQLLVQYYSIKSGEALVEQARKWDNPILITDQNIYANNKFLEHGKDAAGVQQGELYAQLQQLIKTAGKRGKQVDLAKTNVQIAEWQFRLVMRNLRTTLYTDFYTVVQLLGNDELYRENLKQLERLRDAMEQELKAGNIAKKEYLRVQALIISLQHDITENSKNINDAESELKTLLAVTGERFIKPVVSSAETAQVPEVTIQQLTDSAKQNNPEYRIEAYQLQYSRQNLRLQKALAVPDVTVAPEFDQNANYINNYVGLTLSLPIPLWDRNRGNIKAAKYGVQQEELMLQAVDQRLQNDVMNAYQKLLYEVRLASANNNKFYEDYYQLQQHIADSYNKRQIGLIEFLDYYKDYQEIRVGQLEQALHLRLAGQALNDITGTDIIH